MNFFSLALVFGCASLFVEWGLCGRKTSGEEVGRYRWKEGEALSATLSGVENHVQQKYAEFRDLLKSGDPERIKSAKKRIEARLKDIMVLLKITGNHLCRILLPHLAPYYEFFVKETVPVAIIRQLGRRNHPPSI